VLLSAFLAAAGVLAAEVDASRVAGMTGPDAGCWQEYVERSTRLAAADQDALQAEVAAAGLTQALKPPTGGDFRPPDGDDREWFAGAEAGELADAVISFQAPSGGWSKHLGYGKGPRRPGMQWTSQSDPGRPPHYLATFDNGATVREIEFLAAVGDASERADCRAAAVRGLEFILNAQFPNGGWPQVYPLEGGYHDNVTFNDNAMTNVLRLLQRVVEGDPRFAFVSDDQRRRFGAALDRGLDWVIAAQVEVDGRATVWSAQHDPITRKPAAARAFEPASLSGVESAQVLKFLMGLRQPSPELVSCIEKGLAWLEAAEVKGITRAKRDGRTLYVVDAASTEGYWARFYDLTSGRPIFPGKDGVVYESFEAMAAANEDLGYDYYSTQPGSIVRNGQKKWRKRLAELREDASQRVPAASTP
jgi:PelA/Pel-15E family pectate lyase